MCRAFIAFTIIALLAAPTMAAVYVNEDFTDGEVNSPTLLTYMPGPYFVNADGLTMYGGALQTDWRLNFGTVLFDLGPSGATLQPGEVWSARIGVYSNYWTGVDPFFNPSEPYICPAVSVIMDNQDVSIQRSISAGTTPQVIVGAEPVSPILSYNLIHAPSSDTLQSANASTLNQITYIDFAIRTGPSSCEYSIRGPGGSIQDTIDAPDDGTLHSLGIRIQQNTALGQDGYYPTIRLSNGDMSTLVPDGTFKTGVTSFRLSAVKASDFNSNGISDLADGSIMLTNWQKSGKTFFEGDANGDGIVDLDDGSILLMNWPGGGCYPPQDYTLTSLIPEPATTTLLAIAGAALLARRRRAA